jgi:DNA-binding NtrC family response regulator
VKFAEQYYPDMLPNLSSCRSPQQMFGSLCKEKLVREVNRAEVLEIDPTEGDVIPLKLAAKEASIKAERDMILKALRGTNWNKKRAAHLLQISYKALLYKIKECGIEK